LLTLLVDTLQAAEQLVHAVAELLEHEHDDDDDSLADVDADVDDLLPPPTSSRLRSRRLDDDEDEDEDVDEDADEQEPGRRRSDGAVALDYVDDDGGDADDSLDVSVPIEAATTAVGVPVGEETHFAADAGRAPARPSVPLATKVTNSAGEEFAPTSVLAAISDHAKASSVRQYRVRTMKSKRNARETPAADAAESSPASRPPSAPGARPRKKSRTAASSPSSSSSSAAAAAAASGTTSAAGAAAALTDAAAVERPAPSTARRPRKRAVATVIPTPTPPTTLLPSPSPATSSARPRRAGRRTSTNAT
jgi:hypothetical protein